MRDIYFYILLIFMIFSVTIPLIVNGIIDYRKHKNDPKEPIDVTPKPL